MCFISDWFNWNEKKERYRIIPGFKDLKEVSPHKYFSALDVLYQQGFKRYRLMASFQMTDSQKFTITLTFADKKRNPTGPIAGATAPQWFVDNAAMLSLTPSSDGLSCVVSAVGPLGTATVSVKVNDASGNPLASGSLDVVVVGGAPSNVVMTPSEPSEQ